MGSNDTFVNMDELRGWGVRALRETQSGKIATKKGKYFLQMIVGTGIFLAGLSVILDATEKYGIWEGVENTISKRMDAAYIEDAHGMGYKIDGE